MYQEVWKQTTNPLYQVSNLGRVHHNEKGIIEPKKRLQNGNEVLYYYIGKKQCVVSNLMKTYHKWEWIRELDDDEECKELEELPGLFITTRGRIWSMIKYRWLKPRRIGDSYYYGIRKKQVHRLVGKTFLDEFKPGLLVLHKDETLPYPEINYVENLWIGTHKENTEDMYNKNRRKIFPKHDPVTGRFTS